MAEEATNTTQAAESGSQQEGASGPNLNGSAIEHGLNSGDGLGSARSETVDERYDRVFDRLAAGNQKAPDSPAPLQGENTSPKSPETAAAGIAAAPVVEDPYEKLDPASMQAMRQTGRLLPVGAWSAMAPLERAQWVRESKLIVAERTRAYQAAQQQAKQPAQQAAPAQAAAKDAGDEIFGKLAEKLSLQPDEAQLLREAVSAKIASAMGGFDQLQDTIGQLQRQNQFLINRLEQTEEASAFKDLEEEMSGIPQFKTDAERAAVKTQAGALLRAQWELGNTAYTLAQATVDAARSRYFKDLQQQAQLKLADKQAKSLKGTMDRGSAARPQRANGSMSREDRVLELMDKGLKGQQLVDALR